MTENSRRNLKAPKGKIPYRLKKENKEPEVVVCACNPSYTKSGGRRSSSLRPAQKK
jgi:hypothetical protein